MKRGHNTIALEFKAGLVEGVYEPDIGEAKAKLLRRRPKTQSLKLIRDGDLRKDVEKDLRKHILPGRIPARSREAFAMFSLRVFA